MHGFKELETIEIPVSTGSYFERMQYDIYLL